MSDLTKTTHREEILGALQTHCSFDVIVIGGGATGLGVALDAASRGLSVFLAEAQDFSKGTSSRSTKLIHGGVRYLAQGDFSLVREALSERILFFRNAPHLTQPLSLIIPSYSCGKQLFYRTGLFFYDKLSGKASLGRTRSLNRCQTLKQLPEISSEKLMGGVEFWDGQFNDARFCIELAQTAQQAGALLMNYFPVVDVVKEQGIICGVICKDLETQKTHTIKAPCVINCAGVWGDDVRKMVSFVNFSNKASNNAPTEFSPMQSPSQGVHIVVARKFLSGKSAILVPKTQDGRVLFVIPWLGHVLIGTTDTARDEIQQEPRAQEEEIQFLLKESARVLSNPPQRRDVLSIWAGLRPLVKENPNTPSKKLSRTHVIHQDSDGLVTLVGGKWTIYRKMAEDLLVFCFKKGLIFKGRRLPLCTTSQLLLVGAQKNGDKPVTNANQIQRDQGICDYGSRSALVQSLTGGDSYIIDGLSEAMVRYAARYEWARTVEDVLARRTRWLFIHAQKAKEAAARVAAILFEETKKDPKLASFLALCDQYQIQSYNQ